jgi:hypothetical protein
MLRVDYADCYGTLVVGPNGAFVHHWSAETKRGVFICQEIVPVITEEHGPHFDDKEARRRIVAPDNHWYWLTHETHFSSLPDDSSR